MNQFTQITSRDNQKLKFVRATRDGREQTAIFIEGVRLADEALKTEHPVKFALIGSGFNERAGSNAILSRLRTRAIEIFSLDERLFASVSDTQNSQGVILIMERPRNGKDFLTAQLPRNALVLLLHKINNPSNLGAILRTAEAAGVSGIITTKGSADAFSSKALRGGMGANLRLPFWTNADFPEALQWAGARGLTSVCADIRARKSYTEIDWKTPRLLIMGSEGHGLSDTERSLVDENLVIPMLNEVESLNVAVACGIILFEAKKQKEGG